MNTKGHNFIQKNVKKTDTLCEVCNEPILPSNKQAIKCKDCELCIHQKCLNKLTRDCNKNTKPKRQVLAKKSKSADKSTTVSQHNNFTPPTSLIVQQQTSPRNQVSISHSYKESNRYINTLTPNKPEVSSHEPTTRGFNTAELGAETRVRSFSMDGTFDDKDLPLPPLPPSPPPSSPSFLSRTNSEKPSSTTTDTSTPRSPLTRRSMSTKQYSASILATAFSNAAPLNAYEPALKLRPLPPLPGMETQQNKTLNPEKSKATTVSSSKKPPSVDEIRARIVNELLSTEEYYISCLQKLTNVYVPTLREHGLSEKDIKSLFSNLETILKFNQELYKELKNAITSWTPTQTIGNIFITMAPFLKMYDTYASNYSSALELYASLMEQPKYAEVFEECRKKTGGDLETYLITPIQRVPRYELLLRDLLKHTPETHPDYHNLEEAVNKIKSAADHINAHVKTVQNSKKMIDLGMAEFVAPHRQFVREGVLNAEANGSGKRAPVQFVLFSDILIKNENPKKKIKPEKAKYQWPLRLVWIKDIPDSIEPCFTMIGPDGYFKVFFDTPDAKASWMQDLRQYILTATKYKKEDQRRYGKYTSADGSTYDGWWFDGMRHGVGTLIQFGNKYVGEWKNNKRSGQGTMYYVTNGIYKGSWFEDLPHGQGNFVDASGNVYSGEWFRGMKQGYGVLTYQNGDMYVGQFKANKFDGNGTLKLANGMTYEGSWEADKFHGKGTLIKPSGKKYEGEWQHGQRHGKGVLIDVNGDRYDGEWQHNMKHGQGKWDRSKGAGWIYTGNFVAGRREGYGIMIYKDGSKYEGQWKANQRHGKGTFYYFGSSLVKYTGEWHHDMQSGQGQLVFANGSRYEGSFKNDKFHGTGVFYYNNGVILEGKWVDGTLEGKCTIKIPKPHMIEDSENNQSNNNNNNEKQRDPTLNFITLNGTISQGFLEVSETKGYKLPIQFPFSPDIPIITLSANISLE